MIHCGPLLGQASSTLGEKGHKGNAIQDFATHFLGFLLIFLLSSLKAIRAVTDCPGITAWGAGSAHFSTSLTVWNRTPCVSEVHP